MSWARSFRSFDFSRARHAFHVVEYGQVMCPPGDEDAWFATLPNNIKEGLQSSVTFRFQTNRRALFAHPTRVQADHR